MISICKKEMLGFILFTIVSTPVISQSKKFSTYSKFEVGGGLSAYVYQGDLTPKAYGSIKNTKPGLLLFVNYKWKPQMSLQASYNLGFLKGNDASYSTPSWRRLRNFTFKGMANEIQFKAIYQPYKNYEEDQFLIFPYVHAGLGLSFLSIQKDYSALNNKLTDAEPRILAGLSQDNQKGPARVLLTIPFGAGVRKMLTPRLDGFAELNYRYTFNDYIDGFSESANSNKKDRYYSVNIGLIYKFWKNNNIGCPTY
jgi:hypothetical protein